MPKQIRFSIGAQINFFLSLIFLAFVGFVVYNYSIITQLNERYKKETDQYSEIMELKNDFQTCDKRIMEYVKNGNSTVLAELNDEYESIIARINKLYHSMNDEEARYLIKSINNSFESYYQECSSTAYFYNTGNAEYFNSAGESGKISSYLVSYADDLLKYTLNMSIMTKQEVEKRQASAVSWNFAIAVSACLLIAAVNFYIRNVMTHPINILSNQAKEIASGNLEVKPNNIKLSNDIGILADTFDKMSESIKKRAQAENEKMDAEKRLLLEQKRTIEVEKLLEEARFIALQTQTNPHFLFNTLNSINRTIMFGREEQALMMLDSLAELLRYNLTDGSVPVELGQEINITEKYLNIQKLRFSDRIVTEGKIDRQLLETVRLPKFTLQPIVENAVIHGLEPKPEGGKIIIDVRKCADSALIRIFDNGIGIDRKKLIQLKSGLKESMSKRIGIWNTCQRIRYFTGREDSFRILSKKGMGTLVIIKIPCD